MEVICRRIQLIADAYTNPAKPNWDNAKLFAGTGSSEEIISPHLKTWVGRKAKDEPEVTFARAKVPDPRGAPQRVVEDAVESGGLPGGQAKSKGRGKNRGRGVLAPAAEG